MSMGERRRAAKPKPQVHLPGIEDTRQVWAEHEACFTPRAVAEQPLAWLLERFPRLRGGRFLDPCAGAGVWCQAARAVLDPIVIAAVEPRRDEAGALSRHAHAVALGTIEDALRFASVWDRTTRCSVPLADTRFDVIATNPPWGNWAAIWHAVRPLLAPGGFLVLHGPSTWGHSDEASEGVAVFDHKAPLYQLRVRGRVAYNGTHATDNRKVSNWVWSADADRDPTEDVALRRGWLAVNLPALPDEARRWSVIEGRRVRPGTEDT